MDTYTIFWAHGSDTISVIKDPMGSSTPKNYRGIKWDPFDLSASLTIWDSMDHGSNSYFRRKIDQLRRKIWDRKSDFWIHIQGWRLVMHRGELEVL